MLEEVRGFSAGKCQRENQTSSACFLKARVLHNPLSREGLQKNFLQRTEYISLGEEIYILNDVLKFFPFNYYSQFLFFSFQLLFSAQATYHNFSASTLLYMGWFYFLLRQLKINVRNQFEGGWNPKYFLLNVPEVVNMPYFGIPPAPQA